MLNNIPTIYDGVLYPSKAEAKYAERLDKLKSEGRILEWRRQVPFKVYDGSKDFKMVVDFLVMFKDRQEIHEVKRGYYSDDFKYKLGLWNSTYPHFPYYVTEEDRHGVWTYKTPQQFLRIVAPPEPVAVKLVQPQARQYSTVEFYLSMIVHETLSLFIK
mgnify:CR=1 FL=1